MREQLTAERRQAIEALFEAALDRAPAERSEWLDGACAGDTTLRSEVARLLVAHERADGILDSPAPGVAELADADARGEAAARAWRVGRYRVVEEIGRGGMGSVFLGERDDDQFRQRVAVKVIHHGLDSPDLVGRFLAERQILASLHHPNIARLLDGGVTEDGRPYFVMEYVAGEHLDAYCDRRHLSIDDRLRLFCVVARAVHYAHRNLVVHRDLKPSNILITEEGEPKLLDFGIAKLLDPAGAPSTIPPTRTGLRLMTPEYASPEQVRGDPITTATDVYGLGLVLYELLSGHRAYRGAGRSPSEVERMVCTETPTRPSTAAMSVEEMRSGGRTVRIDAETVSAARGTHPAGLRRKLGGDVDRIVMCTLQKEPERRYKSAEQLAEDIERYLSGQPVRAHRDSVGYRFGKFVQRHRWGAATAVGIGLLLAAYAATVTVQARRIQSALDQARLEAEKAEQVTAFAMGLFEAGDSTRARRDSVSARELLRRGAARAERLDGQPAAQAMMFDVVGRAYQNLGEYAAAQHFLERALATRRRALGDRHATTAESMAHLAEVLFARGQYAAAESLYSDALAVQRSLLGGRHLTVARTLTGLGVLLQARGNFAGAEQLTREALAMRRELLGHDHPEVAQSLNNLALQLQLQGRHTEAEPLYREVLALRRRLFAGEHPEFATAMSNLGLLLVQKGELDSAESLYRAALATRRRFHGDEHPDVALSLGLLGALLRRKGDLVAAESLYRESIALSARTLGQEHPDHAHTMNGLASVLRDKKQYAAAESLYRHVLAVRRRTLGEEHPSIAATLHQLGALRQEQRDIAGAEPLLLGALAMRRRLLGDGHPLVAESAGQLESLYEAMGQPDRAATYRALRAAAPPLPDAGPVPAPR